MIALRMLLKLNDLAVCLGCSCLSKGHWSCLQIMMMALPIELVEVISWSVSKISWEVYMISYTPTLIEIDLVISCYISHIFS